MAFELWILDFCEEGFLKTQSQIQPIRSRPKFFLWYVYSIKRLSQIVWLLVLKNLDYFSVPNLLKTLLSPWKRDIISTQGLSLNDKFRVGIFNLLSRLIGAIIRIFTIIFGLFLTLFLLIFGLIIIMIWVLLPFIILIIFIYGIILIFK